MKVNVDPRSELFRWGPAPLKLGGHQYWFIPFCLELSKHYGFTWPEGLFFDKGGRSQLFINEYKPLRALGRNIFSTVIRPHQARHALWRKWQNARDELMALQRRIQPAYLGNLSAQGFYDLLTQWQASYKHFWVVSAPPEIATWGLEGMIRERLQALKLSDTEFRAAFELLTSPTRHSFFNEEQIDLLQISLLSNTAKRTRALQKHQTNYFWLHNSYADTFVLLMSFFRKEMAKFPRDPKQRQAQLRAMTNRGQLVAARKKRLTKRLRLPQEARKEIELLALCIWWQDQRKKYAWIANHYLDVLLKEAGRRLHVDWLDLKEIWGFELLELLQNPKAFNLKRRVKSYKHSVVLFKNEKMEHVTDPRRVLALFKKYWAPPVRAVREIAGLVVSQSRGPVIGKVRVLLDSKDAHRMKAREILVAGMTSPDYVVAMKLASAIVTDAGGMTSHAAVVSRELGIPCIVGTKVATQVFKDGDRVEVDTEKGMVRKLK